MAHPTAEQEATRLTRAMIGEVERRRGGPGEKDSFAFNATAVDAMLRKAIERSGLPEREALRDVAAWCAGSESPIESVFSIQAYLDAGLESEEYMRVVSEAEARYAALGLQAAVGLSGFDLQLREECPEADNKEYRVDFLLEACLCVARPGRLGRALTSSLNVECDGRDGHEGWERQCEDNARTCDLMESGHPAVIRFPGRAILRHPGGCFRKAVRILFNGLPEPSFAAELADAVRPARRPFRGSSRDRLRLVV